MRGPKLVGRSREGFQRRLSTSWVFSASRRGSQTDERKDGGQEELLETLELWECRADDQSVWHHTRHMCSIFCTIQDITSSLYGHHLLCHLTWIACKQLFKCAEHLTDHWKPKYQRIHWGEIYLAIHSAHAHIHHFCPLLCQRALMQHVNKYSFCMEKQNKTKNPPQILMQICIGGCKPFS